MTFLSALAVKFSCNSGGPVKHRGKPKVVCVMEQERLRVRVLPLPHSTLSDSDGPLTKVGILLAQVLELNHDEFARRITFSSCLYFNAEISQTVCRDSAPKISPSPCKHLDDIGAFLERQQAANCGNTTGHHSN